MCGQRLVVLQIALVGQEPVLYARSVKENVAYGLDCWDLALVERATKLANAHEFITSMTEKYDTNTGEKGLQLSGTQGDCSSLCFKHLKSPVSGRGLQDLTTISSPPATEMKLYSFWYILQFYCFPTILCQSPI